MVLSALGRFKAWCGLARSVVAAEFPEFESVQAFTVLALQPFAEQRCCDAEEERALRTDKLEKLSALLELDIHALTQQFFDHLPIAQHHFDKNGCTSLVAWRTALERIFEGSDRAVRRRLAAHPMDELRKVLWRAFAWGVSTSGVEQKFSVLRSALANKGSLTDAHLQDEAFILSTQGQNDGEDQELALAAAMLWPYIFGQPRRRNHGPQRVRRQREDHDGDGQDGGLKVCPNLSLPT